MKKDGMRQALLYPRDCSMQLEHTRTCRGGRGGRELPYPHKAICRMANSMKFQLAKHSIDNLPNLLIYKKKKNLFDYLYKVYSNLYWASIHGGTAFFVCF